MTPDLFDTYLEKTGPVYVGIDMSATVGWTPDQHRALLNQIADALDGRTNIIVLRFSHTVLDQYEFQSADALRDMPIMTLATGHPCNVDHLGGVVRDYHRARYGETMARLFVVTPDGFAAKRVPFADGVFTVFLAERRPDGCRAPYVEIYQKAA